jgi:hypothetical protein
MVPNDPVAKDVSLSLEFRSLELSLDELSRLVGLKAESGSMSKGVPRHGHPSRCTVLKIFPKGGNDKDIAVQFEELRERWTSEATGASVDSGTPFQVWLSIAVYSSFFSTSLELPGALLREIGRLGWSVELSVYAVE